MSKNISIAVFVSVLLHSILLLNAAPSFNVNFNIKSNLKLELVEIKKVNEELQKKIENEIQEKKEVEPVSVQENKIIEEKVVEKTLPEKEPLPKKNKELKPIVTKEKHQKSKEVKPTINEIVNTHLDGTADNVSSILKVNDNFNDDKVKVFIPNEKVDVNESAYIKNIVDKIKNYATNFYPSLAKGTTIKLKLMINKNGTMEVDQLQSNRSQEINDQIIQLIKQLTPYPKPEIIHTEKVIIIRNFVFE